MAFCAKNERECADYSKNERKTNLQKLNVQITHTTKSGCIIKTNLSGGDPNTHGENIC